MPRACTICTHLRRAEIETWLARKRAPLDATGKRFGVSISALCRHRDNHMEAEQLKRLVDYESISPDELERLRQRESDGLINELVNQRARLFRLADMAADDGDIRAAVQAERAVTAALRLTAEALNEIGAINRKVTINLLASDDFVTVRSAIMAALRRHPDARREVADALAQIEKPQMIEGQPC